MDLAEFALSVIINLISEAIVRGIDFGALPFFERRKIQRRIEDATAEVVEPLLPFLAGEGIDEDKRRRLIQTCIDELRPLSQTPAPLDEDRWNTVTFLWAGIAPVADVESFIDLCLTVGSFQLAFGILYDQYTHLPGDMRRRILLNHVPSIAPVLRMNKANQGHYWNCSLPSGIKDERFVPTIGLRGVAGNTWFHQLVEAAVADGTLNWSDFSSFEGPLRDLFWMTCAVVPEISAEWQNCLTASCPGSDTPQLWYYWSAESSFLRAAISKGCDFSSVVRMFSESSVQAYSIVALALMSAILELVAQAPDFRLAPTRIRQAVITYVGMLSEYDENLIPGDWLIGTRFWTLAGKCFSPQPIGDLLRAFKNTIQELVLQEASLLGSMADSASNFVARLNTLRQSKEDMNRLATERSIEKDSIQLSKN